MRGCPFRKVERSASWVRTPALKLLQKIPTHSRAVLLVFSSSNSSLWRRPHILISDLIIFSSKESPSLILPHILIKPAPVTGRTSTSKTVNAPSYCAYDSFLQCFRPLVWLSHSTQTCSLTKVNSASEIFGNPFQGFPHISSSVSLFAVSSHSPKPAPSAEQASTSPKVEEASLKLLSPFSSSGLALWRACRTLFKWVIFLICDIMS